MAISINWKKWNDIYNIKEAKNITSIYTLHLVIAYITPDLKKKRCRITNLNFFAN